MRRTKEEEEEEQHQQTEKKQSFLEMMCVVLSEKDIMGNAGMAMQLPPQIDRNDACLCA